MNRCAYLRPMVTRLVVIAASCWVAMVASTCRASPVEVTPIVKFVDGPPYPTGPLTADIYVTDVTGPVTVDQLAISFANLDPLGTVDWYLDDVLTFGAEHEVKESKEKHNTEDINIGVGELQECSLHFETDMLLAMMEATGTSGAGPLMLTYETVSPLGTVAYTSTFTTPQTATFTGISLTPGSDGRSFDLTFSLLYGAPYTAEQAILHEVLTGEFTAVPEPTGAAPCLVAIAMLVCLRLRRKR